MMKKFCLFIIACVLFFLILEGFFSTVFVVYKMVRREASALPRGGPERAETLNIRYDQELGWVSVPNYYKKDFYAPGIYMRTNSQGFRNNEDFSSRVPPGKLRVICSGDSFTFGVGVDNDHTWCQLLESRDHRLQGVNLGEGGYGVDQMYLRYRRESAVLDHDVHVLAFITEDFRRLQIKVFSGRAKPILWVQNGELIEDNVPAPRNVPLFQSWAIRAPALLQLRSFMVIGQILQRVTPKPDPMAAVGGATPNQRQVVTKIIEELQAISKQKHAVLVFVYIPSKREYNKNDSMVAWRKFLREETAKRGVVFVDLVEDFQELSINKMESLYIHENSGQYFSEAPGHMTEDGNEYLAEKVYSTLISIPGIATKLSSFPKSQTNDHAVRGHKRSVAK